MAIWRQGATAVGIGGLIGLAVAWHFSESVVSQPIAPGQIVGVASVIDGDTLDIHGTRIRFHGVDAPESAQLCVDAHNQQWRCGQRAALALSDHIGRATIACEPKDKDQYGRTVAICRKDGEDLNAWMVRQGWAVAYRQYSRDYVPLEDVAKTARSNIWASKFTMPWDWRHEHKGTRAAAAPPAVSAPVAQGGCNIKGNINGRGEHVYHVPGGRFYDETQIATGNGERWFCTEAEAKAAGWRPSLR